MEDLLKKAMDKKPDNERTIEEAVLAIEWGKENLTTSQLFHALKSKYPEKFKQQNAVYSWLPLAFRKAFKERLIK